MRKASVVLCWSLCVLPGLALAAPPRKASMGGQVGPRGATKPAVATATPPPAAPEPPPATPAAAPAVGAAPPGSTQTPAAADPPAPAPAAASPLGEAPAASASPNASPLNPEPPESPRATPAPGPLPFDQLVADIATLRARVAALTTSLFSSKLRVTLRAEGDDARVQSLAVTLDDGVVFRGDAGFLAEDDRVVYEHAVAPGNHVLGVEIERVDARGATYRSFQSTRFSVQVPERKLLEAGLVVEDDSDMAEDFPEDEDGEYELSVRLRARVQR